jgi:salicylate hydroxylase
VLIAGGGLGGLCLAQGLRKRGVDCVVYEQEAAPAGNDGYRIHVNQTGSRALHDCLPSALWDAFVATAGQPCAGLGFFTERMRELVFVEQRRIERKPRDAPYDPITSEHPVSRVALRQVLLGGLGRTVCFGKGLVRYEATATSVRAFFGDGSSAEGDVLVAADGVGSRVRQQYLPEAKVVDTGIVAIAGRLPVDRGSRQWLPEPFLTRLNNIIPPRGCGMFIAQYLRRPERQAFETGPGRDLGLSLDGLEDHVFWAFIAKRLNYSLDGDLRRIDGTSLQKAVLGRMRDWHPDLLRLVAESGPQRIAAFRVQSAEPIPSWKPTRVVLLGDAIHAMTPLQGLGGNAAFRDASLLCRHLAEVNGGRAQLYPALQAYQDAMIHAGFEDVRRSRKVGELAVSDGRIGRSVFKAVLRLADRVGPLKERMFGARTEAGA